MAWHKRFDPSEVPEYIEGKKYTGRELDLMAESLLREDARKEKCRICTKFGALTGEAIIKDQFDKQGKPILDEAGKQLRVKFPEYVCENDHKWYKGEGKAKGISGKNPILFEEHIIQRKRREIMSNAGTVDPSIVEGMYFRSHPQGRKINNSKVRKEKGLGFYS